MNIRLLISAVTVLVSAQALFAAPKTRTLQSPDGRLAVTVEVGEAVTYSIALDGHTFILPSPVSMTLSDGRVLGKENLSSVRFRTASVRDSIDTPLYRQARVEESYNALTLSFARAGFALEFRAYDEGIAYRFSTSLKDSITVVGEEAVFSFDKDYQAYIPYSSNTKNPFQTSFESQYTVSPLSGFESGRLSITPLLVALDSGEKVLITESDLESYPGMFLGSEGGSTLRGAFAGRPTTYVDGYRCQERILRNSDTLAITAGTRTYPWRIVSVASDDTELPVNDLVWLLGSPSRIEDLSWIRPGQAAWEWWNDWGFTGVDFEAGINTDTYKYMIDFAAERGIPYVVVDEGWSPRTGGDIMKTIPGFDVEEVARYGKSRGVGVILWAVAYVLDDKLEEACRTYSGMGIAGFKVDFMDRDDQEVVEMNYRILETAARYHLVVDLHGMYKPTGLNRTWPNLLNYEGVWGLEQMKWSDEDMLTYDVTFPYIRMAAGPVDYTQGALRNAQMKNFAAVYSDPMSQGTRAHQVALYVIFDSPLTMLCDSPTAYVREQETTEFITAIPTVYDETRVLAGEIGRYIITQRRSGDRWYIGGITGTEARTLTFTPDLPEGSYTFRVFRDGVNAASRGEDYRIETLVWTAGQELSIEAAPGGGFAIIIDRK